MKTRKLAIAALLAALAVVGSLFSFPLFGSKCAPVQHLVSIVSAVLLGPWYGVWIAFVSSLLRNMMGIGTPMAFPGSMFGACLSGIIYYKSKKLSLTLVGEMLGTSILGGLAAYPVAILLMGKAAGDIAFYFYILPFLISSAAGAVLAGLFLLALRRTGTLKRVQNI